LQNSIKAILFDLDGTLLDTARDLVAALNFVCQSENLPVLEVAGMAFAVSQGAAGLITAGMPAASPGKMLERKQKLLDYYQLNPYKKTIAFAGIAEVLLELDKRQIPWGVVTNKPEYLSKPVMQLAGLAGRCGSLVCGDTLPVAKPWPEPLILAARQLGFKPEQCVYIGDDPRDMQAAAAANMPGYHVSWGYGTATTGTTILHNPADILSLLQS